MKKSLLTSTLILSLLSSTFVPSIVPVFAEETTTVADETTTVADETTTVADETKEETTEANSEESKEDESNAENSEESEEVSEASQEGSEESNEKDEAAIEEAEEADWDAFKADLQELLEAESVESLYKNMSDLNLTEDVEGIDITIHGYHYYEVTNFDDGWEYSFGDQNDKGGVIVFDITLKNTGDQDLYPVATFNLEVAGDEDNISHASSLVKNSKSLNALFYTENNGVLKAGTEVRGFYPLTVTLNSMEKIEAEGFALMETPSVYTSEDFNADNLLARGYNLRVPLTTKGEEAVAAASEFYADIFTQENWGTKEMVDKAELGETIESEGLSITVEGYEITKLEPNDDYKDRFTEFKDGIYLLTVQATYDNQTKKDLALDMVSGNLSLADMISYYNEGTLEPRLEKSELPAGETATRFHTFLLDGKTYEKFSEDNWVVELKPTDTEYDQLGEDDAFFFTIKE